ncbi:zeta toxin family protein [Trueperella pyogenes]
MNGQLSAREIETIFATKILPDYIHQQSPRAGVAQPEFVSVGGQPGSGKGHVLDAMSKDHPGAAIVNGDDLRQFHPSYGMLMETDPLRMPEVTGKALGPWVGMATEYLRSHRMSAIVETTLRDPHMLRREFAAYKNTGYRTELRVLAAPLAVSRLGTLSRYPRPSRTLRVRQMDPISGPRYCGRERSLHHPVSRHITACRSSPDPGPRRGSLPRLCSLAFFNAFSA